MVRGMSSRTTADLIAIADGAGAGKSRLLSELPNRLLQAVTAARGTNQSVPEKAAAEVTPSCLASNHNVLKTQPISFQHDVYASKPRCCAM